MFLFFELFFLFLDQPFQFDIVILFSRLIVPFALFLTLIISDWNPQVSKQVVFRSCFLWNLNMFFCGPFSSLFFLLYSKK
jgi:hypothetical protein